jgi:hypothetical protein
MGSTVANIMAAVTIMVIAIGTIVVVGIMMDSTVTIGSVAETAENFTAAIVSMEEPQCVAAVPSTVAVEVMAADTGNRGFFA